MAAGGLPGAALQALCLLSGRKGGGGGRQLQAVTMALSVRIVANFRNEAFVEFFFKN